MKRRYYCLVLALLACLSVESVAAKRLDRAVALYPLQCDETFSCPTTLLPRVGFWVEVFSRWDTNTAIFHDKDNPHRVYSTISRKEGCRRSKKGDSIDRERRRLKKALQLTASKLDSGKALSESQTYLHAMFTNQPASEIRAAANRIRCQSGNQDRMREALEQFQRYRPTILDALEANNLTPELQYLPFVESAFNPEALSHVGAAGLWQIMPSTGRTLGLSINNAVDERYDPKRATYAAAQYFRNSVDDLSETAFENGYSVTPKDLNPFVITSYNYGVRGMVRAIKQVGLDYERLLLEYKSPNFQTAVKNFYASFLAARHVAKNAEKFFGVIEADLSEDIFSYNKVKLNRSTSIKRISKELSIDRDLLKKLNPSLKKTVWRDKALVPKGFALRLPYQETGWDSEFANLLKLPSEYEKPGFFWHRVRKGQTACGIADRHGVSCRALIKMNRLNRKATIYVGKRIKVPTNNAGIGVNSGSTNDKTRLANSATQKTGSTAQYRVRSGDTACLIARRHKMTCDEFLAVNGLTRRSIIRIGQRVTVASGSAWHTVKRGQTACQIANSYRVACSALLDANRLHRSSTIRIGQRLRIPAQG